MLNNNHYLVVTTTEIKEGKEKHYSYMMKVPGSNNVWSMLKSIPNIVSANICDTKKAAGQLVEHWNDCYKKNGTYLFDSPSF